MLKASCGVGNVCAAAVLRQQFAVRTHVGRKTDVWLDIRDAGNFRDFLDARIVQNTSRVPVRTLASIASFIFISGARGTIESGKITEGTAKDDDLVEEVERFETCEHVALQAESERHH